MSRQTVFEVWRLDLRSSIGCEVHIMKHLSVCRASHVIVYLDALREIGVPVDKKLGQSGLPVWIEEMPDAYVSQPLALEFVAKCGNDFSPMELGFYASERATLETLENSFQRALVDALTGYARIGTLAKWGHKEDSELSIRLVKEGEKIRVICGSGHLARNPFNYLSEWLNLQGLASIISSVAGSEWRPEELTFMSHHKSPDAALQTYGNTRILICQPQTSMLVDADVLARSCIARSESRPLDETYAALCIASDDGNEVWNLSDIIRSVVRPYLGEGHPDLTHTAEILGISRRTLQRQLQKAGRSYSEIVQEARFEVARDMLSEPAAKIIDVAMTAGYENPQHFSRAFRKFTGVTPSRYRKTLSA